MSSTYVAEEVGGSEVFFVVFSVCTETKVGIMEPWSLDALEYTASSALSGGTPVDEFQSLLVEKSWHLLRLVIQPWSVDERPSSPNLRSLEGSKR